MELERRATSDGRNKLPANLKRRKKLNRNFSIRFLLIRFFLKQNPRATAGSASMASTVSTPTKAAHQTRIGRREDTTPNTDTLAHRLPGQHTGQQPTGATQSTQHPYTWHTYTQGTGIHTQGDKTAPRRQQQQTYQQVDTMSMRGKHPCHEHAHASVHNPDATTCSQSPNAGNTGHSVTPTNGQPHPPSAHAQQPNRNAEPQQ